jgi:hypothetical protein
VRKISRGPIVLMIVLLALIAIPRADVAAQACEIGTVTAEYFTTSSPVPPAPVTAADCVPISHTWTGSPAAGIQADGWSARWTKSFPFDGDTYRFTLTADDRVRLVVDGVTVYDRWVTQPAPTTHTFDVVMTAGNQNVRLVYGDVAGDATVALTWAKLGAATPTPTATNTPTMTPTATATNTPTATPTPPPGSPASVLLETYDIAWSQLQRGVQGDAEYRPRAFAVGLSVPDGHCANPVVSNAGAYAGWDLLRMPSRHNWPWVSLENSVELTLQRSAQVGLVWRSDNPVPPWIAAQGWASGGTIANTGGCSGSYQVFKRTLAAGTHPIPSMGYQTSGTFTTAEDHGWWILLGEANGAGSLPPTVPAGKAVPVPNSTCPSWLHDQHVTTDPAGQVRETGHGPVNHTYWCYYRHEHGDDPALLGVPGWAPPHHYAASADNASEFPEGFKLAIFDDPSNPGLTLAVMMHFGTANTNHICNTFHEMLVAGAINGVLQFQLQWQADFGRASQNNSFEVFVPVTKPQCPSGSELIPGSTGLRQVPVQTSTQPGPLPNPRLYEPWRLDESRTVSVFNSKFDDLMINTPDPQTICVNEDCADPPIVTGLPGAERFMNWQDDTYVRSPAHADAQGYFWTNARATQVVTQGTAGAIRQFIKPGTNINLYTFQNGEHVTPQSIWGKRKTPITPNSSHGASRNPERSITIPN